MWFRGSWCSGTGTGTDCARWRAEEALELGICEVETCVATRKFSWMIGVDCNSVLYYQLGSVDVLGVLFLLDFFVDFVVEDYDHCRRAPV